MKSFVISKKYAPIFGAIIWGIISISLATIGFLKLPAGELLLGLIFYLIGFVPGLLILRRLAVSNMMTLALKPEKVPLFELFILRIWLMMIIMPVLGISSRFLPGTLWWLRTGFLLISGSALLCGSITFLILLNKKTVIERKGKGKNDRV